jgi:SagB-type dehydrogenase family enzyme
METSWTTPLTEGLSASPGERIFELYHENSKLFPALAREMSESFAVSPFDLYLASRGLKQYTDAARVPLSSVGKRGNSLSRALRTRRSSRELAAPLTFRELSIVLAESFEPTAVVRTELFDVEQALRPWPSAGGLYPLDIYVIARNVTGLDAGLYHHNGLTSELERLDARPPEAILGDAFFWQEFLVEAAAVVVFSAVFERTVAKYGERGYRLVLLDAGHAAQNALLTAEQLDIPSVAVGGFDDDAFAADLGLDGVNEAVVHTVALGGRRD